MSYTIQWTSEALNTFEDRITYLKINWTDKEIKNFKARVSKFLNTLAETPYIGRKSEKLKNVYIGLIIKQVSIIYRLKSYTREIEIIAFIDNRQNPAKNQKYQS